MGMIYWDHTGIFMDIASGNLTWLLKIAISGEFSHETWWFSIAILIYQRVHYCMNFRRFLCLSQHVSTIWVISNDLITTETHRWCIFIGKSSPNIWPNYSGLWNINIHPDPVEKSWQVCSISTPSDSVRGGMWDPEWPERLELVRVDPNHES